MCGVVENSLKKVWKERDQYNVGQKDQGKPSHQFRPKPQPLKGRLGNNARPVQPPLCQWCKSTYFGRRATRGIRCYQCQGEVHMARDCP